MTFDQKVKRTPAAIGKANSAKGKWAERELVKYLRIVGFPGAERTVRTGYRTVERTMRDYGDIDGTPGLCWQVKNVDPRTWSRIPVWLAETENQRLAAGADIGLLIVRRPGHADPGRWWAWLTAHALISVGLVNFPNLPEWAGVEIGVPVCIELRHLAPILFVAGYGAGGLA